MTEVLQQFATYRSHGTRSSAEIVRWGEPLLESGKYTKGEDPWAFLEQLAFAALDTGRMDIADDCLVLLDAQFPDSPRVTVLKGQRLEADNMLQDALKMYVYYLTKEDESCVPVRKRLIATLRSLGKITEAAEELTKYLDTFCRRGRLDGARRHVQRMQHASSIPMSLYLVTTSRYFTQVRPRPLRTRPRPTPRASNTPRGPV
ncbi:ER membrane protein complex subunit 2 [Ceratobasidium sp. AG-Ba]|nr:ER membrane protein complex subunit 2 [Ceratobasidium sp. AG-Ba]